MQTRKKKTLSRKPPRKAGKPTDEKNIGARQDGSSEAGSIDAAGQGPGLHLLAKDLRAIPYFEANALKGGETRHGQVSRDHDFEMIDTEEKQLQAIEDLFSIVKAQSCYKKLKEPNWKADTSALQVIAWLLRKLGRLAKGEQWTAMVSPRGRYSFSIYSRFNSQKVPNREFHLPMDFLPFLEPRDKPLHDLIIDVVALASKNAKLPLWDEDGDYSKELKRLQVDKKYYSGMSAEDAINLDVAGKQTYSYTVGVAAKYLKLLKQRRRVVTKNSIGKLMSKYNFKSMRLYWMRHWLREGINLQGDVEDFTLIANKTEKTVGPNRLYKIVWSQHSNDMLDKRITKIFQKSMQYNPVAFSTAGPGQVLKPIDLNQRFPIYLCDWLMTGFKMLFGRHRTYYYQRTTYDQLTPAEHYMFKQAKKKPSKNLIDRL